MNYSGLDTFCYHESEARSYCRRFPTIFSKAKGSYLYDSNGDRFVDFFSGAGSLNFGHNNDYIKKPVVDHLNSDNIMMSLDMHTEAKERFIRTFYETILKPRNLDYKLQFTSPSGTSVVESAVKLAQKNTGRQNVIAFTNAYHGMSAVSLGLTGNQYHRQAVSYGQVTRFPYANFMDSHFDSIAFIRKHLEDSGSGIDMPAAVILETVQGEGGINVAPLEWLRDLRRLTQEYGILLIIDDIQAGCGRTGTFFSFERANIVPDMVCLSKSISGIGFPMALLLLSPELDIWKPGEDNGTFRGNNLAFAASTAMLETYWKNKDFENEIRVRSNLIQECLEWLTIQYSQYINEYRGLGMMYGIEFRSDTDANEIAKQCFDEKIIIETCGSRDQVLKIMPALTIDLELLSSSLESIKHVIGSFYNIDESSTACERGNQEILASE